MHRIRGSIDETICCPAIATLWHNCSTSSIYKYAENGIAHVEKTICIHFSMIFRFKIDGINYHYKIFGQSALN